MFFIVMKW